MPFKRNSTTEYTIRLDSQEIECENIQVFGKCNEQECWTRKYGEMKDPMKGKG